MRVRPRSTSSSGQGLLEGDVGALTFGIGQFDGSATVCIVQQRQTEGGADPGEVRSAGNGVAQREAGAPHGSLYRQFREQVAAGGQCLQFGGIQPRRFGDQVRATAQQVDGLTGGDARFGQRHGRTGSELDGGTARRLGEQGIQRQLRFGQVDVQLVQVGFQRCAFGGCGLHVQPGHLAGMKQQPGDALQFARHFDAFDQERALPCSARSCR